MNAAVSFGVLAYMAAMLAVGFWASRRVKNLTDFLVAGRRLPFSLAVTTLFATWFGAGSCMGASGTAYTDGLLGVISDPFAAGLSLILAGLVYVALFRRMELLTVTDVFGRYYGKGAEVFASVLMVPVYIGWLGSQMVALGYLTAREFLAFMIELYGLGPGAAGRVEPLLEKFKLTGFADQLIMDYSHGMRQKVAYCSLFLRDARYIIIDEPLVGLDPIRFNTVVLRGINEHEVVPLVRFALERGCAVRFLELMPIGVAQGGYQIEARCSGSI